MQLLRPATDKELAGALKSAAAAGQRIALEGAASKARMGGVVRGSAVRVTTAGLDRLIEYDPRDLTISVEAGMKWAAFTALTGEEGQMTPLDPPLAAEATVGGVVAANCAGPRRRLYGAARDQVIGMRVATLEGELIQSGGMVVKNVAGYDLLKLMIGSFGTLGAMVSVNFKLSPKPEATATFALAYDTVEDAVAARDGVLQGPLTPSAVELLNAKAAAGAGLVESAVLLVRAGGSEKVLRRYERELDGASRIEGEAEAGLWGWVEDFAARAVAAEPKAAVVRAGFPTPLTGAVLAAAPGAAVARAGSGQAWLACADAGEAQAVVKALREAGAEALVEWAGDAVPETLERWPEPGAALDVMKDVKKLFDPQGLLNPGRLHGRI